MEIREQATKNHYLAVAIAWYLSVLIPLIPGLWLCWKIAPPSHGALGFTIALVSVVSPILAIISPLVVWLVLRHLKDPAAGMTASAIAALSHILLMSGPIFLGMPWIARYLGKARHNSGGY